MTTIITTSDGTVITVTPPGSSTTTDLTAVITQLTRMENMIVALTESVAALNEAVTEIAEYVNTQNGAVEAAQATIAQLTETITGERAADLAEDTAYEARIAELVAQADQQLADASTAATQINEQVDRIRGLVPDTDPVDPPVDPVDPTNPDGTPTV